MIKFDEKVKFVAMDKGGKFRWFGKIPTLHEDLEFWAPDSLDYDSSFLPSILDMSDYECEDWTKSLHIVQSGDLISVPCDAVFEKEELILVKTDSEGPWVAAKFVEYSADGDAVIADPGARNLHYVTEYRKFDKDLLCEV